MKCYECGHEITPETSKKFPVFRTINGKRVLKTVRICVPCQAIAELDKHRGDVIF